MPTCRTCEFCYPRYGCSEAKMPLDCITIDHGCSEHKPRETPLLTDELAEAKARIRRLLKNYREARLECGRLAAKCDEAKAELACYTASVNADAEIGRLVRRMRDGSRLEKDRETYWIHRYLGDGTWRWMNKSEPTTDPAEALRAIQEVGDGEA